MQHQYEINFFNKYTRIYKQCITEKQLRMFYLMYLQFRKYAVPFLLCGRVLEAEEEVSQTTVETSNRVSPS